MGGTRGYLKEYPYEIYFNEFDGNYHVIEHYGMKEYEVYGKNVDVMRLKRLAIIERYTEAKMFLMKYRIEGRKL